MASQTIEGLLRSAIDRLRSEGSPSPRLDAELLLAKILGLDRSQIYTHNDHSVDTEVAACFEALVARRAAHEPVAYLLGEAHFRRLRLAVDPAVLIPRPETEELVDVALGVLKRRPPWRAAPAPGEPAGRSAALVADVGTGSGAIALSLAQEAGVAVIATDVSADALRVAAANRLLKNDASPSECVGYAREKDAGSVNSSAIHATEDVPSCRPVRPDGRSFVFRQPPNAAATALEALVDLRQADLLKGIPDGSLHLVVSNPPYVTSGDYESLAPDVRLYEPAGALDAGPDGLDVIRRLLPEAARALRPGGTVVLEVGYDQAQSVCDLAHTAGFAFTTIHKDLSGKDRIIEATLPGACVMGTDALAAAPAAPEGPWVAQLREALAAGAVIGLPTDTVYGIAARWDSAEGVKRLFTAKGRPPQQPVQVLFASVDAVVRCLPDLAREAATVLAALLPGPYTFVVETAVARPEHVGTPESLGVRVPDLPALLALLRLVDSPLAATSANLSGQADARALADVDPLVLAHCSVAFDPALAQPPGWYGAGARAAAAGTGTSAGGAAGAPADAPARASTVVDLRPLARGEQPVILREGAVAADEVLRRIAALA